MQATTQTETVSEACRAESSGNKKTGPEVNRVENGVGQDDAEPDKAGPDGGRAAPGT